MIAAIENAILARATAAGESGALNYKFGTRETHPDDWDATLRSSTVVFPAIWVNFAGFTATDHSRSGVDGSAQFSLVVAARNRRNKTDARHGGVGLAEPGSLQLVEDAVALFEGSGLGLSIKPLELVGVQAPDLSDEVVKQGISVYVLQWRTALFLDGATDGDAGLGDFRTFNSKWDVPPKGDDPNLSIDFDFTQTLPIEET